jgi:hypothetical protein
MSKWYLKDWDLQLISACLKGNTAKLEKCTAFGYQYSLDFGFDNQYRRFLIADNGGELNIVELDNKNDRCFNSLPLPLRGNEEDVAYRLSVFCLTDDKIDYDKKSTTTKEDLELLKEALNS